MQIYPGSLSRHTESASNKSKNRNARNSFYHHLTALLVCLSILTVIAGFFYSYMSLERKIRLTQKEINQANDDIKNTKRNIEVHNNNYAVLTSHSNIMRKIAEFRLPLNLPRYDQIAGEKMQILSPLQASRIISRPRTSVAMADNGRIDHSRTY